MGVKTYDPSQVSVIIGGSIIKSWETVKAGRDNDRFKFTEGTSGEVTRTKNASLMGTITLTLPQASADNATLSAFEVAGTLIPCMVVDKGGTSLHTMPEGTIVKVPDAEYGKDAGTREWIIKGEITDPSIVGGNN
jgi:hypothetical protein